MGGRLRYTRQNITQSTFYQFPKFLLHDDELASLTNDARVLYALLRNRHEMSIKNGWYDEKDEVYIYFKREEMQELLRVSKNTAIKAINALIALDLVQEERQGQNMPNRIYLLAPDAEAAKPLKTLGGSKCERPEVQNVNVPSNESERVESKQESKKNQKDAIESSPSSPSSALRLGVLAKPTVEALTRLIKHNIGYDDLMESRQYEGKQIAEIAGIIRTCSCPKKAFLG